MKDLRGRLLGFQNGGDRFRRTQKEVGKGPFLEFDFEMEFVPGRL